MNDIMKKEVDAVRLMVLLWKQKVVVLLCGVLVAALVLCFTWLFIPPTYSASAQFYVNNNYASGDSVSSSQISAANSLADTYMVILKSRSVLNAVREETNLMYSYKDLKEMITAKAVDDTEVFEVTVTCTNSAVAVQIVNAITDVLPDKIAAVIEKSSVKVVDYAEEDTKPVGPDYLLITVIAGIVGLILGALIVAVTDLMDTTIASEETLTARYPDMPILAVIPGEGAAKKKGYKGYYESFSPVKQARPVKPGDRGVRK